MCVPNELNAIGLKGENFENFEVSATSLSIAILN